MSKSKKLKPIGEYLSDKEEMVEQLFSSIPIVEVKNMVPIKLQGMPLHELKAECLVELLAMSDEKIVDVLQGRKVREASSDSDGDSAFVISDEEKRPSKEKKNVKTPRDDRSSAERSTSSKRKKKRKEKVDPRAKKKNRLKDNEPSTSSGSTHASQTSNPMSRVKKPIDDDVILVEEISSDEGEVSEKVQEKSLLDLLELEMRARAIRSLLKKEDDIRAQKILSEYRDEPDDLIPVIEEHPKIEILSDSDENENELSNLRIEMHLDGNSLCSKDADVLDSLLGVEKSIADKRVSLDGSLVLIDDEEEIVSHEVERCNVKSAKKMQIVPGGKESELEGKNTRNEINAQKVKEEPHESVPSKKSPPASENREASVQSKTSEDPPGELSVPRPISIKKEQLSHNRIGKNESFLGKTSPCERSSTGGIENAPAGDALAEEVPANEAPAEDALVHEASEKDGSVRDAPAAYAAAEDPLVEEDVLAEECPAKGAHAAEVSIDTPAAYARDSLAQEASKENSSAKYAPGAPARVATEEDARADRASEEDRPCKDGPSVYPAEEDALAEDGPAKDSADATAQKSHPGDARAEDSPLENDPYNHGIQSNQTNSDLPFLGAREGFAKTDGNLSPLSRQVVKTQSLAEPSDHRTSQTTYDEHCLQSDDELLDYELWNPAVDSQTAFEPDEMQSSNGSADFISERVKPSNGLPENMAEHAENLLLQQAKIDLQMINEDSSDETLGEGNIATHFESLIAEPPIGSTEGHDLRLETIGINRKPCEDNTSTREANFRQSMGENSHSGVSQYFKLNKSPIEPSLERADETEDTITTAGDCNASDADRCEIFATIEGEIVSNAAEENALVAAGEGEPVLSILIGDTSTNVPVMASGDQLCRRSPGRSEEPNDCCSPKSVSLEDDSCADSEPVRSYESHPTDTEFQSSLETSDRTRISACVASQEIQTRDEAESIVPGSSGLERGRITQDTRNCILISDHEDQEADAALSLSEIALETSGDMRAAIRTSQSGETSSQSGQRHIVIDLDSDEDDSLSADPVHQATNSSPVDLQSDSNEADASAYQTLSNKPSGQLAAVEMGKNHGCIDLLSDDEESSKNLLDREVTSYEEPAHTIGGVRIGSLEVVEFHQEDLTSCVSENNSSLMSVDEESPRTEIGSEEIARLSTSGSQNAETRKPSENLVDSLSDKSNDTQADNRSSIALLPDPSIQNLSVDTAIDTAIVEEELEEGEIVEDEEIIALSDSDSCSTCSTRSDSLSSDGSISSQVSRQRLNRQKNSERVFKRKSSGKIRSMDNKKKKEKEFMDEPLLKMPGDAPDSSTSEVVKPQEIAVSEDVSDIIMIDDDEEISEVFELDDDDDNRGSNWTARWLDSDNVKKALQTSKILASVRKKLKMKSKPKDDRLAEKDSGVPQLIGSVEEYRQLVKDGTIVSSSIKNTDRIYPSAEPVSNESSALELTKPDCVLQEASDLTCGKQSVLSVPVENAPSALTSPNCSENEPVSQKPDASTPSETPAIDQRPASQKESPDDLKSNETGSNSDLMTIDRQNESLPDTSNPADALAVLQSLNLPQDLEKLVASGKNCIVVLGPSLLKNRNEPPTLIVAKAEVSPSISGELASAPEASPVKPIATSQKTEIALAPAGLNTESVKILDSASNSSASMINIASLPCYSDTQNSSLVQSPDSTVANAVPNYASNYYPQVPMVSYLSQQAFPVEGFNSQQTYDSYQNWLVSQGYQVSSNYGYGVDSALKSPLVYKQWEEYYRKMMEACQEGAARVSAQPMFSPPNAAEEETRKSYSWVFEHSQQPTQPVIPEEPKQCSPPAARGMARGRDFRGRHRGRSRGRNRRIGLSNSLRESFRLSANLNCIPKTD